ncbi:hypothetical protein [Aliivibrio fischeri]|uniref:hypothetical protein n=1 Tax=Aliivibrio fischeri TaxID=668 RepID=UPI001F313FA4|nr:hypothetical protein [Aliivibrio fischeri]MCE4934485.1 hypothetical protein [Aliivibrio fischeri]
MDLISKSSASIANSLAKSFASNVIERWTRRRAEKFFEEFQVKIAESRLIGDNQIHIAQEIEDIISTELGSEVVFDAYRRVSLAKSKVIGPRIIGFLTAEICLEKRLADDVEDLIFSVAETLNDIEMLNSMYALEEWFERAKAGKRKGYQSRTAYIENNELFYVLEHHESETTFGDSDEIDLSINGLDEEFGVGLQKLKNLGLLTARIRQSSVSFTEDSERHIDYDGSAQITLKTLSFPLEYRRLLTLISQMSKGVEF